MAESIQEPTTQRSIAGVRYTGKDTRQKPFVSKKIEPVNNGDLIPATSPDWTPELQNGFEQSNPPLQPWTFRMRYDGDLQFLGVLDAQNAAKQTIAMTLPGVAGGTPDYVPSVDQSYNTFVTVDGVTAIPATASVDEGTGDVTMDWGSGNLAIYEIKVFEDINQVITGADKFVWEIPEDLDNSEIIKVEGFISTAGGSTTQIDIRHSDPCDVGASILSTVITIDAGECNSKDAATQPVVSGGAVTVAWGDHLHIDVQAAGSGAKGLGIIVTLTPSPLGSVTIQGSQGPPGGVTQFQGPYPGGAAAAGTPGGAGSAWMTATGYTVGQVVQSGGTYYVVTVNHTSGATTEPGVGVNWMTVWTPLTYTAGDIVTNNGVVYVVTVDHTATTATEPGVGVDWEDVFAPFFDLPQQAAVEGVMIGGGFPLDIGVKGYFEMPFDGTITAGTLLADIAGDLVVDIWKSTYAAYPPTVADSITGGSPLTITASNKTKDTTLTGWTTVLTAGDILAFNIDSVDTITKATVSLKVARI